MTLVKICGITRVEDARVAVDEGARAIGFVFWSKSPRYVAPERAREIVERLTAPAIPVGVFVNQSSEDVNEIARMVGLGAVQLHGDETLAAARAIDRPVIKALGTARALEEADQWPKGMMLLVDAHDAERRGGTGTKANWAAAATIARRRRMLLAGGLTAENVVQAIREVRPYGVDVSSGVEISPGIKDARKIAALFKAVEAVNR